MKQVQDLTGRQFGYIKVISLSNKKDSQGKLLWNCTCECGKNTLVRTYSLLNGVKSCGCKSKFKRNDLMAINQKFASYRRDAEKSGKVFKLTIEEFSEIVRKDCYYCGEKPVYWSPYINKQGNIFPRYIGKVDENYMKSTLIALNGVDRLNSKEGYTIENTVPCCGKCNLMKNIHSVDEFLSHINKIYNYKTLQLEEQ